MLENTSLDHAHTIAAKLIEVVREFRYTYDNRIFKLGVSIGISSINSEVKDVDTLLGNADSACYAAKDSGRGRVEIHSPDNIDLQSRRQNVHWVTRINQAIDENRLVLYFQGIKLLKTSGESHYQVLIRLIDEKGELVPPGAFLPAAERYGFDDQYRRWVMERLLTELKKYPSEAIPELAVSLSGMSLLDPSFFCLCVGID